MVRPLPEAVQHPYRPAHFKARRHDGIVEQLPVYHPTATEGKQQTARPDCLEGPRIEPFVRMHRLMPPGLIPSNDGHAAVAVYQ